MKVSKESVRYSDRGSDKEHCAICAHYQGNNTCEVVAGKVSPHGWCERFKRAKDTP